MWSSYVITITFFYLFFPSWIPRRLICCCSLSSHFLQPFLSLSSLPPSSPSPAFSSCPWTLNPGPFDYLTNKTRKPPRPFQTGPGQVPVPIYYTQPQPSLPAVWFVGWWVHWSIGWAGLICRLIDRSRNTDNHLQFKPDGYMYVELECEHEHAWNMAESWKWRCASWSKAKQTQSD